MNHFSPLQGARQLLSLPEQSYELWNVTFLPQQAKLAGPPRRKHWRLLVLYSLCFTAFTPAWENSTNGISYRCLSPVIKYPAPRETQTLGTDTATPMGLQGRKIPHLLSKSKW